MESKRDNTLLEIIDVNFLQNLQQRFSDAVGVAMIVIDAEGPVTEPSNFSRFCQICRSTEEGFKRCNNCDLQGGIESANTGKPAIYTCHAGLTVFAVPALIGGKHYASVLAGQVLCKEPDVERIKNEAKEIGVDEKELLDALSEIQYIPNEKVEKIANLFYSVANFISEGAQKSVDLIERNKTEEKLNKTEKALRHIISSTVNNPDIKNVEQKLIEETTKLFDADRGMFAEFGKDENGELIISNFYEYLKSSDIKYMDPTSAMDDIFKNFQKNELDFGNMEDAKRVSKERKAFLKDDFSVKSYMLVPIYHDKDYYGILILHYTVQQKTFTKNELDLLKTISNQASSVIYHSKLYQTIKKERIYTKNIINSLNDVLITIDDKFIIQSCNPAVENVFGYKTEECVGKSLETIMRYDCEGKDTNVCLKKSIVGIKKDGTKFDVDVSLANVENSGEYYTLLLVRDITERTKIDKIKNEFVSTVSHELRTPLTSIRGALGLILSQKMGVLPEKVNGLLNIANNNCLRLINLINDILDVEKMEAGKMDFNFEKADIIPLIHRSIQFNAQFAQKYDVKFTVEDSVNQAMVNIDTERIIQVLTNLISNAVKFSKPRSTVKLFVERVDGSVKISVTNYGTEISKDFRDKIFEKFAQADSSDSRKKGGTGLGLSIAKAIVEKMDGTIGFKSENMETTFYFTLPEITTPKAVVREAALNSIGKILICENDIDVANLLSLILKQERYDSDIAYNAFQAKDLLLRGHYDAMTLDLLLPDKDGLTLIKELRAEKSMQKVPIIVVSVIAHDSEQKLDGKFTVIDWIDKPIKKEKLINAMNRALHMNERPKILHVEDDYDVQMITKAVLEKDAEVIQVSNLHEAKEVLKKNKVDMVLLDLELPDGNGIDLLPLVSENKNSDIATVIFSAHNVNSDIAQKVDAVLLKSNTSNKDLLKILDIIKNKKDKE